MKLEISPLELPVQIELTELDLRYAPLRVLEPARQARLAASLSQDGQHSPVLVVGDAETDAFVLIDGYGRVEALRGLGQDLVEAVVLELSTVEALLWTWQLGTRRRSVLEDAWWLQELVDGHGLRQAELARRLRRSKSWISRRLSLVGVLSASAQEAVRTGVVPAHAAMKFLVPLARANAEHAERLVAGLDGTPVTDRQVEQLYLGWRTGNAERQERIVAQPHLFLKVEDHVLAPALEPDDAQKLADELEGISGLCRRIRRRVRDGVLLRATPEARSSATRSLEEARLAFEGVQQLMREA